MSSEDLNAITFIGMSGVGKTHLGQMLAQYGAHVYSCDYEIGTNFLKEDIQKALGITEEITVENISAVSEFVGQVGNAEEGGLPLEEFKRRQKLYYDAECASIRDAVNSLSPDVNTIIDSTGSLCEIEDEALVANLARHSLFIYLEASEADEKDLIRRAQLYPKPLFFPPDEFDDWLAEYLEEQELADASDISPDDFSRWVFPKLIASRRSKYKALAFKYGVIIPAYAFNDVSSPEDLFSIIQEHS